MRRAARAARAGGELAALLLIDLDRFKEVNDTLGHDQGDTLLREVSARLSETLRRGDTLARLGGDEFAVLLRDLPDRGAAAELALRLLDALERPFQVGGVSVQLGASVGVALAPDHGTDVSTLVRRADVAMYEAKREHGRVRVYDAARDPNSPERLQRVSELRTALAEGELVLHYQPKVDVAAGEVTGVEALVRWQHPELGLLPPVEFLPLAERTGMMGDLTRWVVDAALAQARATGRSRASRCRSRSTSPRRTSSTRRCPDAVAERLAHYGVPGERLTCELSEHTVMADPRRANEVLERLRALGVRLSLDDFGTGQSSLAYLKRLPLDEVKIDRAFVSGMAGDTSDALIVRSTIDLARDLGLEVVAEGVEGEEVLERLRVLRCHEAQGFHLSRPLPPDGARGLAGRAPAGRAAASRGRARPGRAAAPARAGTCAASAATGTSAAVWRAGLSGTPSFAATSPASVNSRWSERPSPASATQRTPEPVRAAPRGPAAPARGGAASAATSSDRGRPRRARAPSAGRPCGCGGCGARAPSRRGGRAARCGSAPRRPWRRARRRSAARAGPSASPTSVPTPEALSSAPGDGGTVSAWAMITNRQSRGVS